MPRHVLEETHIHPAIKDKIAGQHRDIVDEVLLAKQNHKFLIVGMKGNTVASKARKLLSALGVTHHYLEYGNYFSGWRRRNALKMWTGWPTFPMVFVDGVLIGGCDELKSLIDQGEIRR